MIKVVGKKMEESNVYKTICGVCRYEDEYDIIVAKNYYELSIDK